jgi:hypothetical protein
MARRPSTEAKASPKKEESTVSATTEAPAEAATTEVEIDLAAFNAAVEAALPERDETTGTIAEAFLAPVTKSYRELEGSKGKAAARKAIEEAMKSAMLSGDMPLARAYLDVQEALKAGGGSKSAAERKPVDPTENYVNLVAGLALATELAQVTQPEGVSEEWATKVTEQVEASRDAARAYLAWASSSDEDKGEAPEVPAFVQSAVKLALGKSAKVGSPRSGGSTFTGERRDVGQHILSAFADVEPGTFLKVSEIRKHKSEEYGNDSPSAGAISARLFPKSGNCTVEGIEPGTDADGNKGATKL